jgi:hypothetical protein
MTSASNPAFKKASERRLSTVSPPVGRNPLTMRSAKCTSTAVSSTIRRASRHGPTFCSRTKHVEGRVNPICPVVKGESERKVKRSRVRTAASRSRSRLVVLHPKKDEDGNEQHIGESQKAPASVEGADLIPYRRCSSLGGDVSSHFPTPKAAIASPPETAVQETSQALHDQAPRDRRHQHARGSYGEGSPGSVSVGGVAPLGPPFVKSRDAPRQGKESSHVAEEWEPVGHLR